MSNSFDHHSASGRTEIQRQMQQDWQDREFIEVISGNIKKVSDFMTCFDLSCRTKLATLNEKLATLERKLEFLEARASDCSFFGKKICLGDEKTHVTKGDVLN